MFLCAAAADMTPRLSPGACVSYVCYKCVFMHMFVPEQPEDARAICLASLFMSQAFPALRCVCAPAMNRAFCPEHTAEPSS